MLDVEIPFGLAQLEEGQFASFELSTISFSFGQCISYLKGILEKNDIPKEKMRKNFKRNLFNLNFQWHKMVTLGFDDTHVKYLGIRQIEAKKQWNIDLEKAFL